jgi:hypothetical protein
MQKQNFEDVTYSLAKGLQHVNMAKQYLEDVKRETDRDVKNLFASMILKLDWILSGIKNRISDDSRKVFNNEMSDSLAFDSIMDKMVRLNTEQRNFIESIADSFIKGEEVRIVDESFKY